MHTAKTPSVRLPHRNRFLLRPIAYCRKSNPNILVVQPAQDRAAKNGPSPLDGPGNPLGARAMYLGGTVYRIHGTNAPGTIGTRVSSGCIRLTNEDVADLYSRVNVGTRVVVLPMDRRADNSASWHG
jgi:lipoprotein-anchoring transpeptidase ErfK/SrfK